MKQMIRNTARLLALLLIASALLASCGGSGNVPEGTSAGSGSAASGETDSGNVTSETVGTVTTGAAPVDPTPVKALNYVTEEPEGALYQKDDTYYVVSPIGIPNEGEMFVNHELKNRSGHFGHAMVEYADGKILAFYPNCNTDNGGHSGRGWMEYKRSEDYGKTWSDPIKLPYSYRTYVNSLNERSIICEKAVVADDGTIVLFCLQCDVKGNALWEPYFEPTYITSSDGGETWSEPTVLSSKYGRVYDVIKYKNGIYVLAHLSETVGGASQYYTFVSKDNGKTFTERSNSIPFPSGTFYGTMEILPDNRLIAYVYHPNDETQLYYSISANFGLTWGEIRTATFARCIRNPQMIAFDGAYFIMGRSSMGTGNNIIYFSTDGIKWDAGHYLSLRTAGIGAYSNAIIVGSFNDEVPDRVLYQASKAYKDSQTNVLHWWIDSYHMLPQFSEGTTQ